MAGNVVWLNYKRIQLRVDITLDDLIENLKSFRDMRGGKKRVLFKRGEYFLNRDYVDEFITKFNLVSLKNVPLQDKNWISSRNLSHILHVNFSQLIKTMQSLKDDADMKDNNGMNLIQFRRTAQGRYISLCLFNSDEAKNKLATKVGKNINRFSAKVPYKMQYNWSEKRKFSDDEIDSAIIRLIDKNYDFVSEMQCADALLSELPKSPQQILLAQLEKHVVKEKD